MEKMRMLLITLMIVIFISGCSWADAPCLTGCYVFNEKPDGKQHTVFIDMGDRRPEIIMKAPGGRMLRGKVFLRGTRLKCIFEENRQELIIEVLDKAILQCKKHDLERVYGSRLHNNRLQVITFRYSLSETLSYYQI